MFWRFGAEEEIEGDGRVACRAAARGVEEGREVFEGGGTEAGFAYGEVGEGRFVAEVGEEGDAGEPLEVVCDRGCDGLGTPEGEKAAGGGGFGAVAGEQRGSGRGAEWGVVIDEEGWDAGEDGVGAGAEVDDEEGLRFAFVEALVNFGLPGIFEFAAGLGGDAGIAGGVEGTNEEGGGGEAVGIGVREDVDAGCGAEGQGLQEVGEDLACFGLVHVLF